MRKEGRSLWWGAGSSILVHGTLVGLLLMAPHRRSISEVLFSAEVDLSTVHDPEDPEEETPEEETPEEDTPEEATPTPVRARLRPPTPMMGALVPDTAATVAIVPDTTVPLTALPGEGEPSGAEVDPEAERARIAAILDPTRYARDSVIRDDPGPSRRGPPAGGGDATGGLPPEVALLTEAEAEAAHTGHLAERAAARPWLSHTPIVPVEQSDGSWVYAGPLFTARIAPDGAVSFTDRGAVDYDLGSGSGSFDLTDMVMGGAGADPYAAERERFMEETEELRVRLEDAAREEDAARALRRIRGRLVSIWGDDARTAEARRRALFSRWDECSDDVEGNAIREAVIAFIRENLPEGSPDAYTPSEIAGLNATRESAQSFDPY